MTTSLERIQILTDLLEKNHIKNVIFSPGSRNAPLVLAIRNNEFFNSKVIVDERSAGFIALGMAQQLQEPVIICSTSGSAALNYAPAICEAFYQKIPLIVLTADRPPEWIDQGEGQSINQNAIYNNYIAGSFQFPVDENPDTLWQSGRITNEAINLCVKTQQPVHINLPFREPLYETVKHSISRNKIELTQLDKTIKTKDWELLTNQWNSFSRKLIICGLNQKNEKLNFLLNELSSDEQTIVLTETTSNLIGDNFIQCIDRTLERVSGNPDFNPELIISLGGSIISKKIKLLFRKFNPKQHWHVNNDEKAMDVFTSLTRIIPMEEDLFFESFISRINTSPKGKFKSLWLKEFFISQKKHLEFLQNAPWSDLKAHQLINQSIPSNTNLHVGNSTSIRYVQLFNNTKKITFNSNRGVSGIDGSTSTAIGAAIVNKKNTLLITGDLSFVYDSNALWNNYIPENLKIIVLNNDGGGIFKIIPGPSTSEFLKENFVSNNTANIKLLAEAHQIKHLYSSNEKETENQLLELFNMAGPVILEIDTKKANNNKVLKDYFKALKS